MRRTVLVLLAGCVGAAPAGDDRNDDDVPTGPDCANGACIVTGPSSVTAPSDEVFAAASSGATGAQIPERSNEAAIDLGACTHQRLHWWLPLGSAWFLVHPVSDAYCEVWLGGETENPGYDGAPAQYCLFDRKNTLVLEYQVGGPITLENMPWCVLL